MVLPPALFSNVAVHGRRTSCGSHMQCIKQKYG